VIPVIAEFSPEMILVSCGFDAAKNDPIGACNVTPQGFENLTYMLSQYAGGKVVLALEGGYHLDSVAQSSISCARALLGNSPRPLPTTVAKVSVECISVVNNVIAAHSRYWKCFGTCIITPETLSGGAYGNSKQGNIKATSDDIINQNSINSLSITPIRGFYFLW
jgi:histone deacetylase 6